MSAFEFVVVCALRTEQLIKGCRPRVTVEHRHTTTARQEVATGVVVRTPTPSSGRPSA
ncbi:MAG: hypothetical protein AB7H93_17475 [Vicinamibacterales bacterium]